MIAVNLWYHVRPANEEPGRTGFAHLFEHMMFQGSKHVAFKRRWRTSRTSYATSGGRASRTSRTAS
jgi:zinc protease